MRIAVVCPYPVGVAPSQRLKYEQYFRSWEQAGFTVDVYPFWDRAAWDILYRSGRTAEKSAAVLRALERRRRDLARVCAADLVYLHLEAIPVGPPWFERALISRGIPFVYDVDDLVHLPHSSGANPFMRLLRGGGKIPWLMKRAAHVVVCTPYLEEYATRHNERVSDISSTIDTERYRRIPRPPGSPVVVGWSGSHSTSRYVHLLDDVLKELVRSDGVAVRVIGDPDFSIEGIEVDSLPWSEDTEVEDLSGIDVGLYPLPDEEWVLGKSGLKALQYMALGIPPVAAPLGASRRIIDHGRNGFLVDGPDAWTATIRRLVRDPGLRERIGARARQTVVERFSVQANQERYLNVLRSVAETL